MRRYTAISTTINTFIKNQEGKGILDLSVQIEMSMEDQERLKQQHAGKYEIKACIFRHLIQLEELGNFNHFLANNLYFSTLILTSCKITSPEVIKIINDGLQKNSTLTKIDFSQNNISSRWVVQFSKFLKSNYTLTDVNLMGNKLHNALAIELAEALAQGN